MLRTLAFVVLCVSGVGCVEVPTLPDGSGAWSCQQDKDCEKIAASAHCERGLCVLWPRNENSPAETSADVVKVVGEKTAEGTTETIVSEESTHAEHQEPLVDASEIAQEADGSVENEPRELDVEEVEPENPCTKNGEVFCGGKCVNPQSDQAHCGQCNNACGGGLVCMTGLCMCPKQEVLCGAFCVDLKSDTKHCGKCGASCGATEVCEVGVCLVACEKGETRCGTGCANIQTDTQHCGGCEKNCPVGQVCNKGVCECPAGTVLCGGGCVNTQQDPKHCGGCGKPCGTGLVCQRGACTATCTPPEQACGAVCANTQSDPKHCGVCAKSCPVGGSCQASVCACPTGTYDCSGVCVNTSVNSAHCGNCGIACPADAWCRSGVCYCSLAGHKLCGSPRTCVDTRNDPKHCGFCSSSCPKTHICQNSGCVDAPYTETFSGGPVSTYSHFAHPVGVINHPSGGFLVADITKHQILRVFPSGAVAVFAGAGTKGAGNGAASVATFWGPRSLAWGPNGDLYVVDSFNHRIRKITAQGQVSTFAGSSYGFKDGTIQTAQFYQPMDIVFDAQKSVFYVIDRFNHRVRRITLAGVVTTLAGSTPGYKDAPSGAGAQFYYPSSLALDDKGDLYVGDESNHRIRKVSALTGETTTLAGNGKGVSVDGYGATAGIPSPQGILWVNGSLYVAEATKIRHIDLQPGAFFAVTTFTGQAFYGYLDGSVKDALFSNPQRMVFLQTGTYRNLYVTDAGNRSIRRVFFQ